MPKKVQRLFEVDEKSAMLTKHDLRESIRQRLRILLPTLTISAVAVIAYFFVASLIRESWIEYIDSTFGSKAADFAPTLLILPAFAILLIPLAVADQFVKRYALICPFCAADFTQAYQQVIATKCCPTCQKRIVLDGRLHTKATYKRYQKIRSRKFLVYWFWAWPMLALVALAWHSINPNAFDRCQHVLFMPALIGTLAAGWTLLRTSDHRYTLQFIVSLLLLALGGGAFWYR